MNNFIVNCIYRNILLHVEPLKSKRRERGMKGRGVRKRERGKRERGKRERERERESVCV